MTERGNKRHSSWLAAVGVGVGALAFALGPAAAARPVGEIEETLTAAIDEAPATAIARVVTVERVGHSEFATVAIEAVLVVRDASLALAPGAVVMTEVDARLDHAVRLIEGERVLLFVRAALGDAERAGTRKAARPLLPLAALALDRKDPDSWALEDAARSLAAVLAMAPGSAADLALAPLLAEQAARGPAGVARDAAVELLRRPTARAALPVGALGALLERIYEEPNGSSAQRASIDLVAELAFESAAASKAGEGGGEGEGGSGRGATVDAILFALAAPDAEEIALVAARALDRLDPSHLAERLERGLVEAPLAAARAAHALVIAELRIPGAAARIAVLLDDADPRARVGAVRALATLPGKAPRALLTHAADRDPSAAVRAEARAALSRPTR